MITVVILLYFILKSNSKGGGIMFGLVAFALANIGELFAKLGSNACVIIWLDEPEMPKNLIN